MRTRFATAGSLYIPVSYADGPRKTKDKLEACQIPNHPLVDAGKGHLSVAAIRDDVKDDPIEGDKPLNRH
jgi:hypothetical protein